MTRTEVVCTLILTYGKGYAVPETQAALLKKYNPAKNTIMKAIQHCIDDFDACVTIFSQSDEVQKRLYSNAAHRNTFERAMQYNFEYFNGCAAFTERCDCKSKGCRENVPKEARQTCSSRLPLSPPETLHSSNQFSIQQPSEQGNMGNVMSQVTGQSNQWHNGRSEAFPPSQEQAPGWQIPSSEGSIQPYVPNNSMFPLAPASSASSALHPTPSHYLQGTSERVHGWLNQQEMHYSESLLETLTECEQIAYSPQNESTFQLQSADIIGESLRLSDVQLPGMPLTLPIGIAANGTLSFAMPLAPIDTTPVACPQEALVTPVPIYIPQSQNGMLISENNANSEIHTNSVADSQALPPHNDI